MKSKQVDPRDVSRVLGVTAYRVYFWDDDKNSDEWRLVEVKGVAEAWEWATASSAGRSFEIFAEVSPEEAGVMTLIRLQGEDPTGKP